MLSEQVTTRLDSLLSSYLKTGEMSGGEILLRDKENVLFHRCYGDQSPKTKEPVTEATLYRMMSMTKVVTALAAARLMDRGLMDPEALVSDYIPSFANVRVADDPRYVLKKFTIWKVLFLLLIFSPDKVKTVPLQTKLTVKTLLTHSCGIEQGTVGILAMQKNKKVYTSLEERVEDYAKGFLSFQPGTKSSYSPIGAMDVLGVIMGKITGKTPAEVLQDEVLTPLKMSSTGFTPVDPERVIALTKFSHGKVTDKTGSKQDLPDVLHAVAGVCDCSGGLYGTVSDYAHIAEMLLNKGVFEGSPYLSSEMIRALSTPCAPESHMEGQRWGLGLSVRENDTVCPDGCYGWSGAYGTHFLVDPTNEIALVFAMNRTNIGGASSYISRAIEKVLFNKE